MAPIHNALARMREAAPRALAKAAEFFPAEPLHFAEGCSDDELEEFQTVVGAALPREYLDLLRQHRRVVAMDIHNGYTLFSPMQAASSQPRRIHVTHPQGVLEERRVVPVGGDGGGNLFLLTIGSADQDVWKWTPQEPLRPDGVATHGATQIAESLVAFLERVAEDWERFASNDQTWDYLSG